MAWCLPSSEAALTLSSRTLTQCELSGGLLLPASGGTSSLPCFPFCFAQWEAIMQLSYTPQGKLPSILLSSHMSSLIQMGFPLLFLLFSIFWKLLATPYEPWGVPKCKQTQVSQARRSTVWISSATWQLAPSAQETGFVAARATTGTCCMSADAGSPLVAPTPQG